MSEFTYTLTAPEIRRALWATRRPPAKAWTQTALLVLLSLSAIIAAWKGNREGGTLLVAVALPVFTAAIWVIPAVSFRREAAEAAPLTVTLTLWEDAIAAGGVSQKLTEAAFVTARDMVVWRVDKTQSIIIPRRAVSEESWQKLTEIAQG